MEVKTDREDRIEQANVILGSRDITGEEQRKFYDIYAKYWDEDQPVWFFNREKHVDEFMDFVRVGKDARILDVACGTGLTGQLIAEKGFTNIDAYDSSDGMLQQAKAKGIYRNYIRGFVRPEAVEGVEKDTYDVVIGVAAIARNHISYDCFESLVSIVKPGGYIYFVSTHAFCFGERKEFEDKMRKMQEEGKWRWVLMKESPDEYYKDPLTNSFDQTLIYAFTVM